MSIRKVNLVPGEFYHIYNRGNSKQKIFHDKEDYFRFIGLMYACNQTGSFKSDNLKKDQGLFNVILDGPRLVSIGAYCLMPNHFHICVTTNRENGISEFMQKLITAYVMYYNKKYKRTGSLLEGKFKSKRSSTDTQLKYLFSYINLNPVKLIQKDWKEKGIKNSRAALEFLKGYEYSSFGYFIGEESVTNLVIDQEPFPNYFSEHKSFYKEILEWLYYKDAEEILQTLR